MRRIIELTTRLTSDICYNAALSSSTTILSAERRQMPKTASRADELRDIAQKRRRRERRYVWSVARSPVGFAGRVRRSGSPVGFAGRVRRSGSPVGFAGRVRRSGSPVGFAGRVRRSGSPVGFVVAMTPSGVRACRRNFKTCRFGEKCLYVHPECRFNKQCTRPDCPYTHTARSQVATLAPSSRRPPQGEAGGGGLKAYNDLV